MNVLIVDDTPTGRLFSRAALLAVSDGGDHRQQRAEAAGQVFDIREFHIGGAAIKNIQAGYQPDLAIIDINFSELNFTDVERHGFDPGVEVSAMRGFDILDALKAHSPGTATVFVTAYAGDDELIGAELQRRGLRLGQGYYVRTSKAIGINDLSLHLKACMETIANNWAEQIPLNDAGRLITLKAANQILSDKTVVNDREISLKSMLAHTATFDPQTKTVMFANPAESIYNLLPSMMDMDMAGHFRQTFVQQAIRDFRNSENFRQKNEEINAMTANYILRFLQASHNNDNIGALIGGFYDFYDNGNVGQIPHRYGENPWSFQFINALKQRRALLGLSRLAAMPVWGLGRNRPLRNLLCQYMKLHGRSRPTEDNIRQHLHVRGLLKVRGQELLQTDARLILPEEEQFLHEYFDLILQDIRASQ